MFLENLELGIFGVVDKVEQASGYDVTAHHAADLYAEQTAAAGGLTVDETATLQAKAEKAEATLPVLNKAASATVDQVVDKAAAGVSWTKWVAGGVLVVVGLASAAYLVKSAKAVTA